MHCEKRINPTKKPINYWSAKREDGDNHWNSCRKREMRRGGEQALLSKDKEKLFLLNKRWKERESDDSFTTEENLLEKQIRFEARRNEKAIWVHKVKARVRASVFGWRLPWCDKHKHTHTHTHTHTNRHRSNKEQTLKKKQDLGKSTQKKLLS